MDMQLARDVIRKEDFLMNRKFYVRRFFKYAAALGIMSLSMINPAFAQTEVHILDVGQGLSVLVESQDKYLLYDGGDRDKSSFVVSYLKQQNVNQLDYIIQFLLH